MTSTTRFKFFSAKQVVGANTYSAASTGAFTVEPPIPVTYASSWSEISTPAYTNSGDQNVQLSGRIWPAAAGRPVSLYSGVAADGSGGSWIAGANTDANGRFSFVINVSVVTRFKFFSAKQVIGATTYDDSTHGPFTVRSLRFWDDFSQTSKDQLFAPGRWTVRQPAFDTANRQFSRGDARAVEVGGGALSLKVFVTLTTPASSSPGTSPPGSCPLPTDTSRPGSSSSGPRAPRAGFGHRADMPIWESHDQRAHDSSPSDHLGRYRTTLLACSHPVFLDLSRFARVS